MAKQAETGALNDSDSKKKARLAKLEHRIGYGFRDRGLLSEALTHGSALEVARGARDYGRLEFLGDRVLGLVVAEFLLGAHPHEDEGEIAPRFNSLVNRNACAAAARRADLGAAVTLSPSEAAQGGRDKDTILADICESVIAALYLDGGYEPAKAFVTRFWADAFDQGADAPRDAKTALQEWAAARKLKLDYALIDQSGPDHAPRFVIEARIEGFAPVRGEGGSKRDAQRAAAAAFLAARRHE